MTVSNAPGVRPQIPTTPTPGTQATQTPTTAEPTAADLAKLREKRLLKVNATGVETKNQIIELQKLLVDAKDLEPGSFTPGVFDQTVQDAVVQFQTENGLQIDGVVGQQTWGQFAGVQVEPGADKLKGGGVPEAWAGGTQGTTAAQRAAKTNGVDGGATDKAAGADPADETKGTGETPATDEEARQAALDAQELSEPKGLLGSTLNAYAVRVATQNAPERLAARQLKLAERAFGKAGEKLAAKEAEAASLRTAANAAKVAGNPEAETYLLGKATEADAEAATLKATAGKLEGRVGELRAKVPVKTPAAEPKVDAKVSETETPAAKTTEPKAKASCRAQGEDDGRAQGKGDHRAEAGSWRNSRGRREPPEVVAVRHRGQEGLRRRAHRETREGQSKRSQCRQGRGERQGRECCLRPHQPPRDREGERCGRQGYRGAQRRQERAQGC